MSIRELPDATAFYTAARDYCRLVESEPTNAETWGKSVLTSLACLYARAHSLPECGLLADALDVPDDFDVTNTQYREVFSRLSHLFGAQDSYWCYFDPTEPPDAKEEPVFGLLPDDLADIYRDVAPGVRCWDSQRDEFLHSIIFRWSWPLFHTHWGCHAVSAMRALHELVYARGFQPSAQQVARLCEKSRRARNLTGLSGFLFPTPRDSLFSRWNGGCRPIPCLTRFSPKIPGTGGV